MHVMKTNPSPSAVAAPPQPMLPRNNSMTVVDNYRGVNGVGVALPGLSMNRRGDERHRFEQHSSPLERQKFGRKSHGGIHSTEPYLKAPFNVNPVNGNYASIATK